MRGDFAGRIGRKSKRLSRQDYCADPSEQATPTAEAQSSILRALAGIPDALNEGSPYRGVCLRRSKAMKGTSLSGFCTIVTHREGIAQVVYAYIGTRKLRNSGRTSGVSLPICVRISHHLFSIDGKQLRNAYSASAWNIAQHMSCNS